MNQVAPKKVVPVPTRSRFPVDCKEANRLFAILNRAQREPTQILGAPGAPDEKWWVEEVNVTMEGGAGLAMVSAVRA